MALRKKDVEELDSIIETMSVNAIKQLVYSVTTFSCVPRKIGVHGCNSCVICWLRYLEWLRDNYNSSM